jgi:hypothetical protein
VTRQQAIGSLTVSLTQAMSEWLEHTTECSPGDAWDSLGIYTGPDLARAMARSAVSVLEGVADAQDYLRREKLLED